MDSAQPRAVPRHGTLVPQLEATDKDIPLSELASLYGGTVLDDDDDDNLSDLSEIDLDCAQDAPDIQFSTKDLPAIPRRKPAVVGTRKPGPGLLASDTHSDDANEADADHTGNLSGSNAAALRAAGLPPAAGDAEDRGDSSAAESVESGQLFDGSDVESEDGSPHDFSSGRSSRKPKKSHRREGDELQHLHEPNGQRGSGQQRSSMKNMRGIPSLAADMHARIGQVRSDFSAAMKSLSNTRSRRQGNEAITPDEVAVKVVARMQQASQRDAEAKRRKVPGLAKLKLLPQIERLLERPNMKEALLRQGLLGAFKDWLEPQRDSSLPLYDVRSRLFSYLVKLPIEIEHLTRSKIGILVLFYSKCPAEVPDIRKLAHECVTKWSRLILKLSDSYRESETKVKRVDLQRARARQDMLRAAAKASEKKAKEQKSNQERQQPTYAGEPEVSYQRTRVPLPAPAGYLVMPTDNLPLGEIRDRYGENNTRTLDKFLNKLKSNR